MKEFLDAIHIQLFVRYDNMHLYERLTIRTAKKIFRIDLGNILRETNNKR